jgi:hypothetical protein
METHPASAQRIEAVSRWAENLRAADCTENIPGIILVGTPTMELKMADIKESLSDVHSLVVALSRKVGRRRERRP